MNIAIVLAAGVSQRFGKDKLFLSIHGMPVLYYAVQAFHDHPEIDEVHVVGGKRNMDTIKKMVKKYHFPRIKGFILGGKERQDSMMKALKSLKGRAYKDIILIHNGANPLVTPKEISDVIKEVKKHGAAAVGKKIVDTIKEVKGKEIVKTHDRENLVGMQTPQAATYGIFVQALSKAAKEKKVFTDDAAILENAGQKVVFVPGSEHNFKITTIDDYQKLKVIMGDIPSDYVVGLGQDSHEYETEKNGLFLGGIFLKNEKKLKADSDGDVLLHALYNAISQALGEGSLGRFATSLAHPEIRMAARLKEGPMSRNGERKTIINSQKYIEPLLKKMQKKRFGLNNMGIMIECAHPRIDPLVPALKDSLKSITGLPLQRIGITATTGEKLTAFGRGEGIQCFVIVSLKKT